MSQEQNTRPSRWVWNPTPSGKEVVALKTQFEHEGQAIYAIRLVSEEHKKQVTVKYHLDSRCIVYVKDLLFDEILFSGPPSSYKWPFLKIGGGGGTTAQPPLEIVNYLYSGYNHLLTIYVRNIREDPDENLIADLHAVVFNPVLEFDWDYLRE